MGCYPIKQLSKEDEILLQREKKLGLHNFKITEIKEVRKIIITPI